MRNPVSEAKEQCNELILAALGRAVANNELPAEPVPAFSVEAPSDVRNGDLATNVALVSAKAFKLAPKKIAEVIASSVVTQGSFFSRVEVAGPGFLNFFLDTEWFSEAIRSVHKLGAEYGRTDYGKGKKVLVEFVSANPTGPMHIGNARGGAIGDSLASVLDWSGHKVAREFYVNDAGNQINKLGISLEARYLQQFIEGVEIPEDAYLGEDIIAHAKAYAAIVGDSLVEATPQKRRAELVAYALPLNITALENDLRKYRIEYDVWFMESVLHKNGEVEKVIALLKEKGCTYESEGALWLKATEYGADSDFVLVRSNGVPTYVVPDIAYHYNKLVTRGFDKAINVLGADHHGYVPRLKAALSALLIDPSRLDVVLMQMVRLVKEGEIIKASKRSGKAITLVTLLDEVPIDAARFFFNQREANTQMDFDLDLAVEESSQNPVYYVQYAHARVCSVLKALVADGINTALIDACDLSLLSAAEEAALIRHIALLPQEIAEAARLYEPSRIIRYVTELATLFHKFYSGCRIKCEDTALCSARAALCVAVKTTLANTLTLLKIDAPEVM